MGYTYAFTYCTLQMLSYHYALVLVGTAASAATPPQHSQQPRSTQYLRTQPFAVCTVRSTVQQHAQSLCAQSAVDHSKAQLITAQAVRIKRYGWWMQNSLILSIATSEVYIKRPSEASECIPSLPYYFAIASTC